MQVRIIVVFPCCLRGQGAAAVHIVAALGAGFRRVTKIRECPQYRSAPPGCDPQRGIRAKKSA